MRSLRCHEQLTTCTMDVEEKQKLMAEAHSLFGPALKKKVNESVLVSSSSNSVVSFSESAHYLDENDLRERFKDRPDVFEHVKKNATTIQCPTRGCSMYEVLGVGMRQQGRRGSPAIMIIIVVII